MKAILFNPFEKYNAEKLLVIGILGMLVGSYLGAFFNARFDGVLDMHFVKSTSLQQVLTDNIINTVCLSLLLYIAAILITPKTRIIDILGVVVISRITLYIVPLINIGYTFQDSTRALLENMDSLQNGSLQGINIGIILLFSLVLLTVVVWYVSLLYKGFKLSANAKGRKGIILFILAIILAELISKFLISQFN
jgi:hypothetical protein